MTLLSEQMNDIMELGVYKHIVKKENANDYK